MKKTAFETCHPLVCFVYFAGVIGFSCFFLHPVCLGIALVSSLSYLALFVGGRGVAKRVGLLLPLGAVMALMNPLFNHQGVTVLWYFPNGNPLTLESVLYGVLAAGMVVTVICWCSSFQRVMTDDKIICLFGKAAPALSLVFSMTLRFVPRFWRQLQRMADVRRTMGQDVSKGSLKRRLKVALQLLSGVTAWALEDAVDTADSMKARGFGLSGRTAYSIFRFDRRSRAALATLLFLTAIVLAGGMAGITAFRCFPAVEGAGVSLWQLPVFLTYFFFCSYPLWMELWEVKQWNCSK